MNDYFNPPGGFEQEDKWKIFRMSQIVRSSEVGVFFEENDLRGYNLGGFYQDYPLTVQLGRWVDFPATWHRNGANIAFADGHVAWLGFGDKRTAEIRDFWTVQAGNKDLDELRTLMVSWRQTGP
jgi:prepilin-type processing-associated H-X9-DG protein